MAWGWLRVALPVAAGVAVLALAGRLLLPAYRSHGIHAARISARGGPEPASEALSRAAAPRTQAVPADEQEVASADDTLLALAAGAVEEEAAVTTVNGARDADELPLASDEDKDVLNVVFDTPAPPPPGMPAGSATEREQAQDTTAAARPAAPPAPVRVAKSASAVMRERRDQGVAAAGGGALAKEKAEVTAVGGLAESAEPAAGPLAAVADAEAGGAAKRLPAPSTAPARDRENAKRLAGSQLADTDGSELRALPTIVLAEAAGREEAQRGRKSGADVAGLAKPSAEAVWDALAAGRLPSAEAVQVADFLRRFAADPAAAEGGRVVAEAGPSPFRRGVTLVRVVAPPTGGGWFSRLRRAEAKAASAGEEAVRLELDAAAVPGYRVLSTDPAVAVQPSQAERPEAMTRLAFSPGSITLIELEPATRALHRDAAQELGRIEAARGKVVAGDKAVEEVGLAELVSAAPEAGSVRILVAAGAVEFADALRAPPADRAARLDRLVKALEPVAAADAADPAAADLLGWVRRAVAAAGR